MTISTSPVLAFLVLMVFGAFLLLVFSKTCSKPTSSPSERKPYACGEPFEGHLIQPDYSQFFSFALFFTILHVVALVIVTVPMETRGILALAVSYIVGASVGLWILLRR